MISVVADEFVGGSATMPEFYALFVVISPFQIVCAQEARDTFANGAPCHLVIVSREPPDSPDFRHKTEVFDDGWARITWLREPKERGLVKSLLRVWLTAKIAARHGKSRGRVFLGDPDIKWFASLGRMFGPHVTWLDDGSASISVLERFLERDDHRSANPDTPRFFTIFGTDQLAADTNGAVLQNNLASIGAKSAQQGVAPKQVWIIGQWLSERGGISRAVELHLLQDTLATVPEADVRYIPHRHESAEKLAEIGKFCAVTPLGQPVETVLREAEVLPGQVLSYYSTALFTIRLLFPQIHVSGVQVPYAEASAKEKALWESVYRHMDDQGIDVLFRSQPRRA